MVQPIAIVVAMQSELTHLIPEHIASSDVRSDIWTETHVSIGNLPIIAVRSGIGMVAAAAASQHLLSQHDPQVMLNFGCTGSHVREQYPGDVVIGAASIAHAPVRIDAVGNEIFTSGGFGVGEDAEADHIFPSGSGLVLLAQSIAETWQPDPWPVGSPPRLPGVRTGNVGSGDVWNQHLARLDALHARYGTLCEDMEAAAIAQVAAMHDVPFLTIKDISNNEYHDVTDFDEHGAGILEAELGKRAATLIWRILESLAKF
ncbi:MAG: 5'-methylthioadenosine/S-adenosylhomocysteine nucleosidase [Thermomicrobiales bacterium]